MYSTRRTHRRYSDEFKATHSATCLTPGVSVAAVVGEHCMNSDVLQRWLKEHRALALVQAPDSISPTTDIALSPQIILQSYFL
ncbi:transposase [Limnohabitans sp. Rim8]|uniref:transposase n=1 Tax=Limnohabitans sp. Rim8 TaxID=1100718 RepID=UPI002606EB2A|nr:transposase [Limnohabitans sp. Rim8]